MITVSKDERAKWLGGKSVVSPEKNVFVFDGEYLDGITLPLPGTGSKVIALANFLLRYLDDAPYCGSFFWLSDWGMWGAESNEAGAWLYKKFLPPDVELIQDVSLLFNEGEIVEQKAALVIPMLFQWDAYLVPAHGKHIIAVSHDEYVAIMAKSPIELERLMKVTQDWNPRRRLPNRFERQRKKSGPQSTAA